MKKSLAVVSVCCALVAPLVGAMPLGAVVQELATGAIAVVGPNSELISFTRQGDDVTIRQCAEGTRKAEVELVSGCSLAEGTRSLTLNTADFRELFLGELAVIGQDP